MPILSTVSEHTLPVKAAANIHPNFPFGKTFREVFLDNFKSSR